MSKMIKKQQNKAGEQKRKNNQIQKDKKNCKITHPDWMWKMIKKWKNQVGEKMMAK